MESLVVWVKETNALIPKFHTLTVWQINTMLFRLLNNNVYVLGRGGGNAHNFLVKSKTPLQREEVIFKNVPEQKNV